MTQILKLALVSVENFVGKGLIFQYCFKGYREYIFSFIQIMKGQPKTQQVAKKFVWCQWDAANQLLYYIHHRKGGNGEKQPVLTCLQFHGQALYDNLVIILFTFLLYLFRPSSAC